MNRVMLLMLTVALTACGSSQPSETVDFLAAHPEVTETRSVNKVLSARLRETAS